MSNDEKIVTLRKEVSRKLDEMGVTIRQTYQELSAKGVEFTQEPVERPYGVEALFRDSEGNWFSLGEK